MMFFGGGMLLVMVLFLLVPLILIGLLTAGGYTLWRGVGTRQAPTLRQPLPFDWAQDKRRAPEGPQDTASEPQRYATAPKHCATCGRRLEHDWTLCPYCGAEIV